MKVIFFNPTIKPIFKLMTAPLGIIAIASFLNAHGHDAQVFDRYYRKENVYEFLEREKPDVIGVSVITNRFMPDALKISKIAKKRNITVIWGGPMATQIPGPILDDNSIDYICMGEGEQTWLEIADGIDQKRSLSDISGIAFKQGQDLIINPERPFLDLSKLPPLDWDLVEPSKYFQPYYGCEKMLYLYSSKGCIGNCTFCYNSQFHHSTHRKRSYQQVIDEIKLLHDKYGMDGVNFSDDLMFCNTKQIEEFCNLLIKSDIDIIWGGNLRVGIVKEQSTFELMHKSGCRWLLIGVETGSKHIQTVISKRIPYSLIEKTFKMSSEASIITIAPFMIGLPEETEDDLRDTIEVAKRLCSAECAFNYYTPIPGTRIYDELVQQGKYNPPKDLKGYANMFFAEHLIYNSSVVPNKDLKAIYRFFKLRSLRFKDDFNNKGQTDMFKTILKNAFKSIAGHGIINFIVSGFFGLTTLLDTFLLFLHPKLRKKYNLYF